MSMSTLWLARKLRYTMNCIKTNLFIYSQCAVFYYIMHAAMHICSYVHMHTKIIDILIDIHTYVLHNYYVIT